jgi:hypothetical protein
MNEKTFVKTLFFVLCFPIISLADSFEVPTAQIETKESANYNKSDKFLPGEEVVTPTGQKMKVWTTEGPVKVSPPPQPFQAPEEQRPTKGTSVLIDQRPAASERR